MIGRILQFLLGCRHNHLTRPTTALDGTGKPAGQPYVVCLDCGKRFAYDIGQAGLGKPLD